MKVILIGGPHNQKVINVKAATPALKIYIDGKPIIYKKRQL